MYWGEGVWPNPAKTLVALPWLALAACDPATAAPADPRPAVLPLAPETAEPIAKARLAAEAPGRPGPTACPDDMVLVEGAFCPAAEQRCEEFHPEYDRSEDSSERCLRFAEPSRCANSRRQALRFCVDRYEWPNKKGALPQVLVSWIDAEATCAAAGKRLCTEREWVFACEGEAMLPYVNGYTRDATACVIDKPYVQRPRALDQWDTCMASPTCAQDFARVDQREPSGAFERCVSPFGVHDMNGNVNEWVRVTGEKYPRRSGLKGGWWGPVRNRCRPTVRFHDESDWGYEIGFRCCGEAKP
jgi:sulfatase modifying factor 1